MLRASIRVRQNGVVVAFCEVKAPNDPWLDEQLDNAPPLTIVGGLRSDPVFNRLARLLSKADAQLSNTKINATGSDFHQLTCD